MKRFLLLLCVLGLSGTGWAFPSLDFTTLQDTGNAWQVTKTGSVYTMDFFNNNVIVDNASLAGDAVLSDNFQLPTLTIESWYLDSGLIKGVLNPNGGQLVIKADVAGPAGVSAGDTVFAAELNKGGLITIGTNFLAYSIAKDDMNVVSHVSGYSAVLDEFVMYDSMAGGLIDLSFSGDITDNNPQLYTILLNNLDVATQGTVSGSMVAAVPAPGSLLLGSLGVGFVGYLRRRRSL